MATSYFTDPGLTPYTQSNTPGGHKPFCNFCVAQSTRVHKTRTKSGFRVLKASTSVRERREILLLPAVPHTLTGYGVHPEQLRHHLPAHGPADVQ